MKWLALRIGGQKWSVYLVSPRSKFLRDEDGSQLNGQAFLDDCRIYVSRALPPSAREDTLLHELVHALLYVSGASTSYDRDDAVEERLVSALTPDLHSLLKDLGFRFPLSPYEGSPK